ncbi:MAG TPA: ABC transporter substrate-binding protein [Xanthomonadales bacterium]|nr:ABC transporter substrate-binding protein [Xanthomonadales bacterium]
MSRRITNTKAFLAGPLAVMLLSFASLAVSASLWANTGDPVSIVKQTAADILADLNANRDAYTADPEQLRAVVRKDLLPLLDLEYSARLILGKAARSASEEQVQAFSEAMSNVLINRYADGLLQFRSSDQLEVMPLKGDNSEKNTRVRTRIKLDNGGHAPVDYAFRKTDEGWKAFDVTVEGISYVITFRNQIGPRVEADGIDKVTADILAGNVVIKDE